ncbi:MAG: hypothetical protein HKN21_04545 [Candidatus Eisenbacteria bacterium]|uniref:FecR protein domain-containing protein n=1 Tax=Eiseniibacteriota bacterium TaxID=2212470 RepID=A0A7Y2H1T9_UNCEI|nr:hypothetical protein [Candidatus Eisenbacteria bacterium]
MSEMPPEKLTAEEARVQKLLRSLSAPEGDSSFQKSLRDQFVSGELQETGNATEAGEAGATATPSRAATPDRAKVVPIESHARSIWTWAVAAAAVVAIVFSAVMYNTGPAYEFMAVRGSGFVEVNGERIAASNIPQLTAAIHGGARVKLDPSVEMDVRVPGYFALQLTENTDMILPRSPGKLWGKTQNALFENGEVRVTTAADFPGSQLTFSTPEAVVEVNGTTLAVIRDEDGTCVCVYSGSVGMSEPCMPPEPVAEGKRKLMFRDHHKEPVLMEITPMERTKLQMFEDAAGTH